jgi:hypothetical protein
MPAPRQLTVVVSLDVAGFTRLVHQDERATLSELTSIRRELIDATLEERNGHIFKTTGDGVLIEFPNIEDAVSWALEFQEAMAARNQRRIERCDLLKANDKGNCGAEPVVACYIDIREGNPCPNQDRLVQRHCHDAFGPLAAG